MMLYRIPTYVIHDLVYLFEINIDIFTYRCKHPSLQFKDRKD